MYVPLLRAPLYDPTMRVTKPDEVPRQSSCLSVTLLGSIVVVAHDIGLGRRRAHAAVWTLIWRISSVPRRCPIP